MDDVARLNARDRAELFREAAELRKDIDSAMIEKDFWVCWTLKRMFSLKDLSAGLIFKGGTSLSKVFKVIDRFSEDIDLSFNRDDLGFVGNRSPDSEMSRKKRSRILAELQEACSQYISEDFLPKLQTGFASMIGEPEKLHWSLGIDRIDPQTLLFSYPPGIAGDSGAIPSYVKPSIKLEMGARSDPWPSGDYKIQSYVSEVLPNHFKDPYCSVHTLNAERTFWEKATLLHAEYYRPEEKTTSERLSRHYYDLALMAKSEVKDRTIGDITLLHAVVKHNLLFFYSSWAQYDSAATGMLHLAPRENRIPDLRRDYEKTKDMIFGPAPSFDDIMAILKDLEEKINQNIVILKNEGRGIIGTVK